MGTLSKQVILTVGKCIHFGIVNSDTGTPQIISCVISNIKEKTT